MKYKLLFLLLYFLSCFRLTAQTFVQNYSINEGLPQSTVTSLFRDNSGYLWVGTGEGLSLFDGVRFRNFSSRLSDPSSLTNNRIRGIIPSEDGKTVWVGSEDGFNQFDRNGNKIIRRIHKFKTDGASHLVVKANDTALWVLVGSHGLFRISLTTEKLYTIRKLMYTGCMLLKNQKVVVADTSSDLYVINIITGETETISYKGIIPKSGVREVVSPWENNDLLILTVKGLYVYRYSSKKIERFSLKDPNFNDEKYMYMSMSVHPDGSWWFAVHNEGIYRYDLHSGRMRLIAWNQDGTYFGDKTKSPTTILCDDYGVVLVGTNGAGMYKVVLPRITVKGNYYQPLVTDTCRWFIRSFLEISPGVMLVGTYLNHLKIVDYNKETIRTISLKKKNESPHTVYSMYRLDSLHILAGTEDQLFEINLNDYSAKEIRGPYPNLFYSVIYKTTRGRILIGSNYKLFEYHPQDKTLTPAMPDVINVSAIHERADGDFLIAGVNNSIRLYDSRLKLKKTLMFSEDLQMPRLSTVRTIHEDENGMIWLASNSGLVKLDSNLKKVATYTDQDGLSDNVIYGMLPYNKELLLLTTGKGVTLFNRKNGKCSYIAFEDGLPSNECNSGALYQTKSGRIFIGGIDGFCFLEQHPGSNLYKSPKLNVYYSGQNEQYIPFTADLSLPFDSTIPEFYFWSTDFAFPQKNRIKIQLLTSKTEEVKVTGNRYRFSSLSSGEYLIAFVLEPGQTSFQLYSPILKMSIIPPVWEQPWFYWLAGILSAGVIATIILMITRMRHRNELRKLMMQQEIEKIRLRISRDIHDDIGAGLTRIALSGDLLTKDQSLSNDTTSRIRFISETARELSQSMKEVVWAVNPVNDQLDRMLYYFRVWIGDMAEHTGKNIHCVLNGTPGQMPVNPDVRRNLLLILKEAVSNAVKYAEATSIDVTCTVEANMLTIEIADNGKGFHPGLAVHPGSNGLRNMKERAESVGFHFTMQSEVGKGTVIRISGMV